MKKLVFTCGPGCVLIKTLLNVLTYVYNSLPYDISD